MLPGAIGRPNPAASENAYFRRALRWTEPNNVFSRVQAELRYFTGWLGLATIAALAISTARVTIRLQVQDLQFRISASRALQTKLLDERESLSQRVTELSNSSKIQELALLKLGMIRPVPGQELVLP